MPKFTLILIVVFLFFASLLNALGYHPLSKHAQEAFAAKSTLTSCVGTVIYDGDTFGCDFDGDGKVTRQQEHIRLIGIDSSEMHYSPKNKTGKDEPYALEAKMVVSQLVLHRPVYLEYDIERYDKYNRTLAYVYLDPTGKTMLNRLMLQKGLARTMFIHKNRRYEADFNQVQHQAQLSNQGFWADKAFAQAFSQR